MINPILGIDTWDGQLEITESILKSNNVKFMFVRLNDMNGGHHKDTGFDKQWFEAQGFYRAPYFVYNPWVNGQANFDWLNANMPADARAVAIDIEVRKADYPPATYAAEVAKFEALVKAKWNYVIYTGEWFLSQLSYWNKSALYWWAQYPYEFYPDNVLRLTWDELRVKLQKYTLPSNAAKVPGQLKFWQFSGDRLILPGNTRKMDVNVFLGTDAELQAFFGNAEVPQSETVTKPYTGVTHYEGTKNGWRYFLQVIEPAKVMYEFYDSAGRETVSSVASRKRAQIATNGGEWNRTTGEPTDYPTAPRLILMNDGTLKINHTDVAGQKSYITGLRYLIRDGVIQSYLNGTEPQYTEGHSRTIEGLTADGRHIQMISEGRYPNQGLTLRQAAEVILSHGAVVAFDSGGGGDTTLYMGGRVLNVPEDISNGVNVQRAIPETVLIYAQENNTMARYTATALGNDTRIRPDHNTLGAYVSTHPMGTKFYGDNLFIATVPLVSNGVTVQMTGDKWLQVSGGWVAITNMGKPICSLVDNGTPPPSTSKPELNITIAADGYQPVQVILKPLA